MTTKITAVGIFKLRTWGEQSYGWYRELQHPALFKTALQAQIALDKENNPARVRYSNWIGWGIGLAEKQAIAKYITNGKKPFQFGLIYYWNEYWDDIENVL